MFIGRKYSLWSELTNNTIGGRCYYCFLIMYRNGGKAQGLRAMSAFPENMGLFPRTQMGTHNTSRRTNLLFWLPLVPGMQIS